MMPAQCNLILLNAAADLLLSGPLLPPLPDPACNLLQLCHTQHRSRKLASELCCCMQPMDVEAQKNMVAYWHKKQAEEKVGVCSRTLKIPRCVCSTCLGALG